MKQEHKELIEAMAKAAWDSVAMPHAKWDSLYPSERKIRCDQMGAALRAANERGFDLCKLPGRMPVYTGTSRVTSGFNAALDAIEIVQVEEGEGS